MFKRTVLKRYNIALPKTTHVQTLDSLQVVCKYIQEQWEVGEEIFYVLNVIDNFRVNSNNKKQSKILDLFKIEF
jgi:hypothetical protein